MKPASRPFHKGYKAKAEKRPLARGRRKMAKRISQSLLWLIAAAALAERVVIEDFAGPVDAFFLALEPARDELCGNQPVCRVNRRMARPCWLRRAVRNRTRRKILISTQGTSSSRRLLNTSPSRAARGRRRGARCSATSSTRCSGPDSASEVLMTFCSTAWIESHPTHRSRSTQVLRGPGPPP